MDIEKIWVATFCEGLSKSRKKKYIVGRGNCLWHLFSYELIDKDAFLVGDKAREAFDKEKKKGAIYFLPFSSDVFDLDPTVQSINLDEFVECYVISYDRKWTYVKTHETDFGPYFYKKA